MNTATIHSAAILGIDTFPMTIIATHSSAGEHRAVKLSGIEGPAQRETIARVQSALWSYFNDHGGRRFGSMSISVVGLPKGASSSHLDLPIVLACIAAIDCAELSAGRLEQTLAMGEVSLAGAVRSVRGAFPMIEHACMNLIQSVVIPQANVDDAWAATMPIKMYGATTIRDAVQALRDDRRLIPVARTEDRSTSFTFNDLLSEYTETRHMIESAVIARRSVLLIGHGRSLVARRIPSLLSPIDARMSARIYSVAGLSPMPGVVPFRSPHHTVSVDGLTGGGQHTRPGEASLAHGGVLFFDDIDEAPRLPLTAIRAVMAHKSASFTVRDASAQQITVTMPADFLLIGGVRDDKQLDRLGDMFDEVVRLPQIGRAS